MNWSPVESCGKSASDAANGVTVTFDRLGAVTLRVSADDGVCDGEVTAESSITVFGEVLAGSALLRLAVLRAGDASAGRPRDYFGTTQR